MNRPSPDTSIPDFPIPAATENRRRMASVLLLKEAGTIPFFPAASICCRFPFRMCSGLNRIIRFIRSD